MALLNIKSVKDSLGIEVLDKLNTQDGLNYYSRFSLNEGIMDTRLSSACRYFFLMPEPEEGFAKNLGDPDEIAETLRVFGDKDVMRILFYLYTRKNTPLSLSLIASKTKIPINNVEKLMDKMCKVNLVKCSLIETENGNLKSYTFFNETIVIPLLFFAKEMRDEKVINWGVWFDRDKPLF